MISIVLQIFIIGVGILLMAILVNFLANLVGVETWYSFIEDIRKSGFMYSLKSKWPHLIFLIIAYPFILGITAYYLLKAME